MTKLSPAADHGDLPAQVEHPFHPGHSLKLVPDDDGVGFRCNGCMLLGTGARYECERGADCNQQDFHIRCALAPALREIGGNRFMLLHEPLDAAEGRTICDACGGEATGFVYHCPKLKHDVHPCCADLPETLDLAGVFLELHMKDDNAPQRHCPICPEKKTWWGGRRRVNRGCWYYRSVRGCGDDDDVFLHVACARDLACDNFTNVNVSLGKAMPARASETTGTGNVIGGGSRVVYRGDQEMVTIKASALRALLLKGHGRGHRGRGRWLRVLTFIVRVVVGVIFGDPTAMFVAVGQALLSGDW